MKPGILVIGSLNVDLTITTERFHRPGETVTGGSFRTYPGGKGGNQAVAAARLGAHVSMAGALGKDDFGAYYRRVLEDERINGRTVAAADAATGVALIQVDAQGENRIIVVPGANALVDEHIVNAALAEADAGIALLQLEIPLTTVIHAARALHARGVTVVLDPAPARELPRDLYSALDFITPNRTELSVLTGLPTNTMEEVKKAALRLLSWGAKAVVAKLGADGCLHVDGETVLHAPGFSVNVVDTTAAGDSFNAGLAYALASGQPIYKALRFANAVGALSTTAAGAQAAMPALTDVERLLSASESP